VPYRKLKELRRAGVLIHTNRGIYGIAPEFDLAFRCLCTVDRLWQVAVERAGAGEEEGDYLGAAE